MANNSQLAKIHIAEKDLGIPDKDYLSVWQNEETGEPVISSRELSIKQADEVIAAFIKRGWKPKPRRQKSGDRSQKYIKISVPKDRPDEFATEKQLKMLAGLWVHRAIVKNEYAFDKFICRIAKVSHYSFLQKVDVQKMIKAIERL